MCLWPRWCESVSGISKQTCTNLIHNPSNVWYVRKYRSHVVRYGAGRLLFGFLQSMSRWRYVN